MHRSIAWVVTISENVTKGNTKHVREGGNFGLEVSEVAVTGFSKDNDMLNTTPVEPRHVSHLERKNFLVDSEEESHRSGPRCQPSHVTANFLGIFHGVVLHL